MGEKQRSIRGDCFRLFGHSSRTTTDYLWHQVLNQYLVEVFGQQLLTVVHIFVFVIIALAKCANTLIN